MKTAMQELLSKMSHPNWDRLSFDARYEMFDKLLEKEKEQIINAYNSSINTIMLLPSGIKSQKGNAKNYYNRTYNQNK